jgi:hypothetical protein
MRILYLLILPLFGCEFSNGDKYKNSISDYRYLDTHTIEGGKKFVTKKERYVNGNLEYTYDTSSLSEDAIYNLEKDKHVLNQFYLGYSEWKTISCIISINESHYWDKAMIGLIEKSDKLRIQYLGQTIYLSPEKKVEINKGKWINEFNNDSCKITITINFDNDIGIMRCITGEGYVSGSINSKTFEEKIFAVYQTKNFK